MTDIKYDDVLFANTVGLFHYAFIPFTSRQWYRAKQLDFIYLIKIRHNRFDVLEYRNKTSAFRQAYQKRSYILMYKNDCLYYSIYYRDNSKSCFFRRCHVFSSDRSISFYICFCHIFIFDSLFIVHWKYRTQDSKRITKKIKIVCHEKNIMLKSLKYMNMKQKMFSGFAPLIFNIIFINIFIREKMRK